MKNETPFTICGPALSEVLRREAIRRRNARKLSSRQSAKRINVARLDEGTIESNLPLPAPARATCRLI